MDLARKVKEAIGEDGSREDAVRVAVETIHASSDRYDWTGIYLMDGDDHLVLSHYLGAPSPHTRIPIGSGICGAAAREKRTLIVADVNADPRYLACSLETRSEIVVPIMAGERVLGEIDIDSHRPDAFGPVDRRALEEVAGLLAARLTAGETGP